VLAKKIVFVLLCLQLISCKNIIEDGLDLGEKNNIIYDGDYDIQVIETFYDKSRLLHKYQSKFSMTESGVSNKIVVDNGVKYQEIEGFGAALTDSSAYLISTHSKKSLILHDLFDLTDGAGISYLRISLGSSDFSRSWYTYADTFDLSLKSFSIDRDKEYLIPLLKEILQINPEIKIMATPWSPPGWMKLGNSGEKGLVSGYLNPEYYNLYAEYLIKTIQAFKEEGVLFDTITLQNEPLHDSADYPCMFMSPTDQAKLVKILGLKLREGGLGTKILLYDHNWDEYEYPKEVMNLLTELEKSYVAGSAWHGYAGKPENMSIAKNNNPDLGIYFSEITGGLWSTSFASNLRWNMDNIIVGSTRNWAKSALFWNLALTEEGKPHIRPESKDDTEIMRGVLTLNLEDETYKKEVEYYILAGIAPYIPSESYRIKSNEIKDGNITVLRSVAFQRPDGSIVLVVSNNRWDYGSVDFNIEFKGRSFNYSIPKESFVVFTW